MRPRAGADRRGGGPGRSRGPGRVPPPELTDASKITDHVFFDSPGPPLPARQRPSTEPANARAHNDQALRRILLLNLRTGRGLDPARWTPATDAATLGAHVATDAHRRVATRVAEQAIVAVSGPEHPGGLSSIVGPPERGGLLVVSPVFRVDDLTPRLAARLPGPVRVLALRSPALVPEAVLDAPHATVLASGSGVEPSVEAVVRALLGEIRPKPVDYLSVGVGSRIDRGQEPGAAVIPRAPP